MPHASLEPFQHLLAARESGDNQNQPTDPTHSHYSHLKSTDILSRFCNLAQCIERNLFRPASFAYYIHYRVEFVVRKTLLDSIVVIFRSLPFINTCTVSWWLGQ